MQQAKRHPLAILAAALCGLAILLQGAMPARAAGVIEVCTGAGIEKRLAPAGHDPADSIHKSHCEHCVLTAAAPAPDVPRMERVRYAVAADRVLPGSSSHAPGARAPPRPPGQAPPLS